MSSRPDAEAASRPQLLLSLEPNPGRTFETFVATGNEVAVQHLERLCLDAGESRQICLWGEEASGKSHLLQAACREVTLRGGRSAWLPLTELSDDDPGMLAGLDALDLVGLDDVAAIAASRAWQQALFDLINEARTSGCRLVIAAGRRSPSALGFGLKDLSSRLVWGAVYRLAVLDDEGKIEALRLAAERLKCSFSDDALAYLLKNYPRSLAVLMPALERLAREAQAREAKAGKRRVTVPFIKETLPLVADGAEHPRARA